MDSLEELVYLEQMKFTNSFLLTEELNDELTDELGINNEEFLLRVDDCGDQNNPNDDWDGKMTSQLQAKSTACNLNTIVGKGIQGEEENGQPLSLEELFGSRVGMPLCKITRVPKEVLWQTNEVGTTRMHYTRKKNIVLLLSYLEDPFIMMKGVGMQFSFDREDIFEFPCVDEETTELHRKIQIARDYVGQMTSQLQNKSSGCNQSKLSLIPFTTLGSCISTSSAFALGTKIKDRANHDHVSQEKRFVYCSLPAKVHARPLGMLSGGLVDVIHSLVRSKSQEKYGDSFNPDKRKENVQRVSSFVTSTIVFLWIIFDIWTNSSKPTIFHLVQLHKQHAPVFIWSSLLEIFGFMAFVWAIATMIVVDAPFSRMQCAMFMFWAILMLVRSAKSITEVYLPILVILFAGWYLLVENQAPHEG